MKSAKKLLTILTTMILSVSMLTACSKEKPKDDNGQEAKTLTVWVHPYVGAEKKADLQKAYDGMTAQLKEKHPNTTVVFEEIPWANRETKIITALAGEKGPDIFYLIPDQLTQFADNGIITPVGELLPNFDLSDFTKTSLSAVTYKDQLYGLPILRESQTFFYNVNILKEIGGNPDQLPTTWAEFEALAEKAAAKGYYARTYEGGNTLNANLYPLIWQAGGDIVNDKNEIFINNEKSVKAFELVKRFYDKGYIAKDSNASLDQSGLFLEGKVLAAWSSGNMISLLKDQDKFEYAIGAPLKEEVAATYGTTGTFVVSSLSKHKDLAAEFLTIMTNTENMKAFNTVTGYIPARVSAQSIFDQNPEMKKMAEFVEIAKPGVINSQARVFMPDLIAKVQAMLEGSMTPKEAADAAAEVIKGYVK